MDGSQHTKRTFSNFIAINVSSQTMREKKGKKKKRKKERERQKEKQKVKRDENNSCRDQE